MLFLRCKPHLSNILNQVCVLFSSNSHDHILRFVLQLRVTEVLLPIKTTEVLVPIETSEWRELVLKEMWRVQV